MAYLLFGFLSLFFSLDTAFGAEIMFEGYYKVELESKHIGYAIQRYEFEPKDKTFQMVSFTKIAVGNTNIQESLKAKANDKFHPLSYQYTSQIGDKLKAIDASFKGEIMTLKIVEGKTVKTETHKIPKDTILSSFLIYIMLQRKLEPNKAFAYSGVAEEEGGSFNGKAMLTTVEKKDKFEELRIVNSFKGEDFVATVAAIKHPTEASKYVRGDVLGNNSPKKNIVTTLVLNASQATEGMVVPNKTLMTLFGNMPTGKANLLAKEK